MLDMLGTVSAPCRDVDESDPVGCRISRMGDASLCQRAGQRCLPERKCFHHRIAQVLAAHPTMRAPPAGKSLHHFVAIGGQSLAVVD
jgi:hypothetical protein